MATQTTPIHEMKSYRTLLDAPDSSGWTELQKMHFLLGMWDGIPGSPVKLRELPEWTWTPNDEWQKLRGILSDHPEHDTTKMKADERAWEQEHDERKFGPLPGR